MLFDCHTHSTNSDGKNSVEEMCVSAIEKGIDGITITDHADMNFYNEHNIYEKIKKSMQDISDAQKKHSGKLKIFKGIELGECILAPQRAKEILNADSYDAVLCSVHYVPKAGWFMPYSKIDFQDPAITDDFIEEYIGLYFDLLSETIDICDFDILAHIHCPARYIIGKHGRECNIMIFEDKIREILKKIIDRNISLELNTARMYVDGQMRNFRLKEVLEIYKQLGGKLITLGSDAHSVPYVSNNFNLATELLKECGFNSICYYEQRKAKEVQI